MGDFVNKVVQVVKFFSIFVSFHFSRFFVQTTDGIPGFINLSILLSLMLDNSCTAIAK